MGLELICRNIDKRCIFPRFGTISGKICSYRYECPRDLVSIFKVWLYVSVHLGVFTGGYLQNYLTLYNLKGFQCACCVRPICVNKRNYLCLTGGDYLCQMNGMICAFIEKGTICAQINWTICAFIKKDHLFLY